MKIMNWNIRWGGHGEENRIILEIGSKFPDLVILTEYKNNSSGHLIHEKLYENGYVHCLISSNINNKNGIGVFGKREVKILPNDFQDKENVLVFSFDDFRFISSFCANDEYTKRFILDIEKQTRENRTIIIGDLNTGPRGSDENRYEDLNRIVEKGYKDIWRFRHTEICWSFQSKRGKSQPDHALVSNDMDVNNFKIDFDLNPIKNGISDHGIMILEIA